MRLTDNDCNAAQFPFLKGCLGLTPASWIADATYIGTILASLSSARFLYSALPSCQLISAPLSTICSQLPITSRFACTPGQLLSPTPRESSRPRPQAFQAAIATELIDCKYHGFRSSFTPVFRTRHISNTASSPFPTFSTLSFGGEGARAAPEVWIAIVFLRFGLPFFFDLVSVQSGQN